MASYPILGATKKMFPAYMFHMGFWKNGNLQLNGLNKSDGVQERAEGKAYRCVDMKFALFAANWDKSISMSHRHILTTLHTSYSDVLCKV